MKTIAKTHNETNGWQENEDKRAEEGKRQLGSWKQKTGQTLTSISEKLATCNLQLGRQLKHRELVTGRGLVGCDK